MFHKGKYIAIAKKFGYGLFYKISIIKNSEIHISKFRDVAFLFHFILRIKQE